MMIIAIIVSALGATSSFAQEQSIVTLATAPAVIELKDGSKRQSIEFSTSNYKFPWEVIEPVVGDINNDGRDELLFFFKRAKYFFGKEESYTNYGLAVYSIEKKGLRLIWSDSGDLHLGCCSAVAAGEDGLLGVGDLDGSGTNKLFVWRTHSDVSWPYTIFKWEKDKLVAESAPESDLDLEQAVEMRSKKTGKIIAGHVSSLNIVKRGKKNVLVGLFVAGTSFAPTQEEFDKAEKLEVNGVIRDGHFKLQP